MSKAIVFQHAYSEPFRGSDLECKDPSLAQQSFKDDADINVLLERFKVTGMMPQGIVLPQYGDFTGVTDYQSAANALLRANDEFMKLPANLRARFENSPQKFLEFCSVKENFYLCGLLLNHSSYLSLIDEESTFYLNNYT